MKGFYFVLFVLILSSCARHKPKIETGYEGQLMPAFDLMSTDSSVKLNTGNIPMGKPTVLIGFETWCPHCKAQTRSLLANIEKIKDFNIYFVSYTQYPAFKEFYQKYSLNNYPNIKAGVDYNHEFVNYFNSTSVPFLAVYDKDKRLAQVFVGKTSIKEIRNFAQVKHIAQSKLSTTRR